MSDDATTRKTDPAPKMSDGEALAYALAELREINHDLRMLIGEVRSDKRRMANIEERLAALESRHEERNGA